MSCTKGISNTQSRNLMNMRFSILASEATVCASDLESPKLVEISLPYFSASSKKVCVCVCVCQQGKISEHVAVKSEWKGQQQVNHLLGLFRANTHRDLLVAGVLEHDHVLGQVLDQGQEATLGVEPGEKEKERVREVRGSKPLFTVEGKTACDRSRDAFLSYQRRSLPLLFSCSLTMCLSLVSCRMAPTT